MKNNINFGDKSSSFIINKVALIKQYIDKMLKDSKVLKGISSELSTHERNFYYTVVVVNKLGSDSVSNHLMCYVLDLISQEPNKGTLVQTECFVDFGKSLVNKYIYILCNEDNRSKTDNEKLTLSQWKKENKEAFEHLLEPNVCLSIAGNLFDFLKTSSINMIE